MNNILCVKFDNSKEWKKDWHFTNGKIYNLFQREIKKFTNGKSDCYYTMCDNNNRYLLVIKNGEIRTVSKTINGAFVDDESIFIDATPILREEKLNKLGI